MPKPFLLLLLALNACEGGPGTVLDVTPSSDAPDAQVSTACPSGWTTLNFSVDDSANQTYQDRELLWTGTFGWDEASNTVTYATSWLPNEGPYPPLYDDGPRSAGGHEAEDARAGDHHFGVSVCYQAEASKLFAYGVLNDELRWVWVGPNGEFEVSDGAEGLIEVPGMILGAHGDQDFKVELELSALHPNFSNTTLDTHRVFIKGSMNAWTPVQLLDNGTLGDAIEGDGIVTYHHASFLGPHDGLLRAGEEAQFVFVIAPKDVAADDGPEYKSMGDAAQEGVSASADCGEGWLPLVVQLSLDSKGNAKNTAIVACPATPECTQPSDCPVGDTCQGGLCVAATDLPPQLFLIMPNVATSAGGTVVTLLGENLSADATVWFDDLPATDLSGGGDELLVTTPAHAPGLVDVRVVTPSGEALFPDAFTFALAETAPLLTSLTPLEGDSSGGTAVTLLGENLTAGASVSFGTAPATDISPLEDGDGLVVIAPPHPAGTVDVTVTLPDGQFTTLNDAFSYIEKVPTWGILDGEAEFMLEAGDAASLVGQVFEGGVTEAAGPGFGVSAEAGWGPLGSHPSDESWSWTPAQFLDDIGNNDRWAGTVITTAGLWSATLRFSLNGGTSWRYVDRDGTDNGLQLDQLSTLNAEMAEGVNIASVTPNLLSPFGGTTVVVKGADFELDCQWTVDGTALNVELESSTSLSFVAPPHAPGAGVLAVSCDSGSEDAASLNFAESWDGIFDGWPSESKLASTTLPSDWGDSNVLNHVYLASDGTHLYIGVDGGAIGGEFGANALVVYLDLDMGAETGVSDFSGLESDGGVDDALGGSLLVNIPGFGAEVAVAALDGSSYDAPNVLGNPDLAGWRTLAPLDDLPWLLDGSVFCSPSGMEAFIPLSTLYGDANSTERSLGVIVRISNQAGLALSNQSLPQDAGEAAQFTLIY